MSENKDERLQDNAATSGRWKGSLGLEMEKPTRRASGLAKDQDKQGGITF
ncbi:hypothetical protein [Poriferisphaera sp. WC338]